MTEVFLETVFNLADRNGVPRPPFTVENRQPIYEHVYRTGQFQVAEQDGRIVSFANAIRRGEQWFLCSFWTLPSYQGKGIGRPLLAELWREGRAAGARVGFTWSSIDFAAITSYLGLGMFPQGQIFTFAGKPRALSAPSGPPLSYSPLGMAEANAIDRVIRGAEREIDQRFFADQGFTLWMAKRENQTVGYLGVQGSVIGPVAWLDDEAGTEILSEALTQALKASPEVRIVVPGMNRIALAAALKWKLPLAGTAHFMATEAFGRMSAYIPSGPILF